MPSLNHNHPDWYERDFRRYERMQQTYYPKVSEGEALASIPKEQKADEPKEEKKEQE